MKKLFWLVTIITSFTIQSTSGQSREDRFKLVEGPSFTVTDERVVLTFCFEDKVGDTDFTYATFGAKHKDELSNETIVRILRYTIKPGCSTKETRGKQFFVEAWSEETPVLGTFTVIVERIGGGQVSRNPHLSPMIRVYEK